MSDWSKAGKKFVMVARFAGEGNAGCSGSQLMPAWEIAKIPHLCDTSKGTVIPDYFDPTFKADWKAYVAAIGQHIAASPYKNSLLYIRAAVGLGGEGFPYFSSADLPQLQAWGYTVAGWGTWQEDMLTSYKSSLPFTKIIFPFNGLSTDTTVGAWAAAQGFGVGQQGLHPGTVANSFSKLRSQYPNMFMQFQTVLTLDKTATSTCDVACTAQGDVTAAENNGAQFIEWYTQDITNSALQTYFVQFQQWVNKTFGNLTTPSPSATPAPTPTPASMTGDINADGRVNVLDLSALLGAWGTANAADDFNHDGTVNTFDLSILLGHWTG
jgi:hypothetical protein